MPAALAASTQCWTGLAGRDNAIPNVGTGSTAGCCGCGLEAHSADVNWMQGQPRNTRNNWLRRANGVLRAVIAAARGNLFAADSLEDWLQEFPVTHSGCQPWMNWSTFMREPPLLPVTFKVGEPERNRCRNGQQLQRRGWIGERGSIEAAWPCWGPGSPPGSSQNLVEQTVPEVWALEEAAPSVTSSSFQRCIFILWPPTRPPRT